MAKVAVSIKFNETGDLVQNLLREDRQTRTVLFFFFFFFFFFAVSCFI